MTRRSRTGGLRALRETARPAPVTQEDLAHSLGVALSTVQRWESGKVSIPSDRLEQAAEVCRVPLPLALAVVGGGITSTQDGEWMDHVVTIEQQSAAVWAWESTVIFGLFQTAAYARAVEEGEPNPDPARVAWAAETRIARQALIHRPDPALVHVVMSEAALLAQAGTPDIMLDQLDHLVEVAGLANVTVQVLPLNSGVFTGSSTGAVQLMAARSPSAPTAAFTIDWTGVRLELNAGSVAAHKALIDRLSDAALDPEPTIEIIKATRTHFL